MRATRPSRRARALVAAATVVAMLAAGAGAAPPGPAERRSGFDFMGPATQAIQRDDGQNPAVLWLAEGEAQWRRAEPGTKACGDCHGDAGTSMRGVAARYPAWDEPSAAPVDLGRRIDLCRERRQRLPPLPAESAERLGLEMYVGRQSRGLPISPPADPRLVPWREQGRAIFTTRFGQLDLSCAQCHDERWGRRLGSATIPQGHPTGYPIYRLEWQGPGSLERRLRGCMVGVRAEPYPRGAPEWLALAVYLASRAAGLPVETPAVRP